MTTRLRRLDAITAALVVLSVVLSVAAQMMLRHGMSGLEVKGATALLGAAATSPWVLAGLAIYLADVVAWLAVLSRIDLAAAYPMGSLNLVLVTVLSALLLRERVPAGRWLGTAVILAGILVVARGERRGPGPTTRRPSGAGRGPQAEPDREMGATPEVDVSQALPSRARSTP